jgi:hypothetical protein
MLNKEVKQKIQRDIVLALNVSLFGRCRTGAIVWIDGMNLRMKFNTTI